LCVDVESMKPAGRSEHDDEDAEDAESRHHEHVRLALTESLAAIT